MGVAVTAVLVLLPGPNLIGYYFVFRVVGHFLSWRGARQALDRIDVAPERGADALSELGGLAHLPREERADRVAALATSSSFRASPHFSIAWRRPRAENPRVIYSTLTP